MRNETIKNKGISLWDSRISFELMAKNDKILPGVDVLEGFQGIAFFYFFLFFFFFVTSGFDIVIRFTEILTHIHSDALDLKVFVGTKLWVAVNANKRSYRLYGELVGWRTIIRSIKCPSRQQPKKNSASILYEHFNKRSVPFIRTEYY